MDNKKSLLVGERGGRGGVRKKEKVRGGRRSSTTVKLTNQVLILTDTLYGGCLLGCEDLCLVQVHSDHMPPPYTIKPPMITLYQGLLQMPPLPSGNPDHPNQKPSLYLLIISPWFQLGFSEPVITRKEFQETR